MLESIVPELAVASKEACIRRLVDHGFLQPDIETRPSSFVFRHSITMEVAYNLLSFARRRTLHERIAAFIERHYSNELQPHYARLARHWELGNVPVSALKYLELAAQQSRNNYANREAIQYARKMFDLAQREKLPIDNGRRAVWEVILGDAYHELSDYENSAEHYSRAMQLLGRRLPGNKAEKIGALMYNGSVQLASAVLPRRTRRLAQDRQADVQRVSHIYEYLSEQYFFQNDSLAVLNGTLASLNLAEQCGAVPETIRGYSALALGMAMSGVVRVARSYGKRAQRLAEDYGSLPEMARVRLVLGVLSYGLGEWDEAEQHAEEAKRLYERLGDRKRAHNSETMAVFMAILRGDIARADARVGKLLLEMSDDWPAQVRAWTLSSRVLIDTIVGQASTEHLNGLNALASAKLIRTDQLLCLGVAATAFFQRQENDREPWNWRNEGSLFCGNATWFGAVMCLGRLESPTFFWVVANTRRVLFRPTSKAAPGLRANNCRGWPGLLRFAVLMRCSCKAGLQRSPARRLRRAANGSARLLPRESCRCLGSKPARFTKSGKVATAMIQIARFISARPPKFLRMLVPPAARQN
jgi:tetratricopeptide (TPR) repeat protein